MQSLPAATWRAWIEHATVLLANNRARIDRMNVYPIADGDTGSNVLGTLQSARAEAAACWFAAGPPAAVDVALAIARGATLGARGNSGVILAQWYVGCADAIREEAPADQLLHAALATGASRAWDAVSHPVEGTMLTVAKAAARGAADAGGDLQASVDAALAHAQLALHRTPSQLPVLAEAGVLDAGGAALVLVLQALQAAVGGRTVDAGDLPELDLGPSTPQITIPMRAIRPVPSGTTDGGTGEQMTYEVMFTLRTADGERLARLRRELDALGDSLVMAGGPELWQVHLHVPDAQASTAALQAGLAAGQTERVRVSELVQTACRQDGPASSAPRVLIAVTHGDGVTKLLHDSGIATLMVGAGLPSTAELLDVIAATGARQVVLLPSDGDAHGAAELAAQRARDDGVDVAVIPTRAVVQTLAAVAVHDENRSWQGDVVAMTRAASATRYAGITVASRTALTMAGPCQVGDVLGLVGGDIAIVGTAVVEVTQRVLAGLLSVGGELVTLVWGADADDDLRTTVAQWLVTQHPFVEVQQVDGGQPRWPVIMGVE
ncbi:MAG: DAK2 domain-containing protein, partial [Actinomycetales bacterium]|nr:DAK2 domain-containing protein [Actinomycetales bacterium]